MKTEVAPLFCLPISTPGLTYFRRLKGHFWPKKHHASSHRLSGNGNGKALSPVARFQHNAKVMPLGLAWRLHNAVCMPFLLARYLLSRINKQERAKIFFLQ